MAKTPVTLANPAANRAAVEAGKDPFTPADMQDDVLTQEAENEETGEEELTPEQEGANREAAKQAFYAEIQRLGRAQGQGLASLISLAEKMVKAGSDRTIEPADIKEVYQKFRQSSNSAAGKNAEGGLDEHSITSNTGKLKLFYNCGAEHQYDAWDDMLVRARDMHVAALRGGEKTRDMLKITATYEALVMVAREQMRTEGKGEEKFSIHPNLLTDDEIREVLMPEGHTKEKSTLDMIDDAISAIERTAKGKDGVRDAFDIESDPEEGSIEYWLRNGVDSLYFAAEKLQEGWKALRVQKLADKAAAEEKRENERKERAENKEKKRIAAEEEKAQKLADAAAKKAAAKNAKSAPKAQPAQAAAAK